jgi:hypothetical protein
MITAGSLSSSLGTWLRPCPTPAPTSKSESVPKSLRMLAGCLERLLPGIEKDVVRQLNDESAGAHHDPELTRVDHRLQFSEELFEKLRSRRPLPALFAAPRGGSWRPPAPGRVSPFLEASRRHSSRASRARPELSADRRALVEPRLQIVVCGR